MAIRIPINLASEPFRRDRPILVASIAVAALLALLLATQLFSIYSDRREAARTMRVIHGLQTQARSIDAEQAKYGATLRQPENAEVLERSLFLNTLIERKSISWTKIFADLEKVMPEKVRLVSVRLPQINTRNQVLLDMLVGAADPTPVLDLLRKLDSAPQFGPATVQNSTPPSQTEPLYRYHVSVSYAQKL
jgi:Tfp pilus assembly protein PilN